MTIKQLNTSMTKLMKEFIKKEDKVSSGSLYESIKFNCTFNKKTFDIDIKFKSNEYILYLEDGKFIQDFLSESKTEQLIADFIASQISDNWFEL